MDASLNFLALTHRLGSREGARVRRVTEGEDVGVLLVLQRCLVHVDESLFLMYKCYVCVFVGGDGGRGEVEPASTRDSRKRESHLLRSLKAMVVFPNHIRINLKLIYCTHTHARARTFSFTNGPLFTKSGADMGGVTWSIAKGMVNSCPSPSPPIFLNVASFLPPSTATSTV